MSEETEELHEMLKKIKANYNKMFSIESSLEMILRNAQVEEEEIDDVFNAVVHLMQKALSDESLREEILNISTRKISDDDE